jgi:hypothetical protein
VAQIARIIEEVGRADGYRFEIDGPVHEACRATDGEDDGTTVVDGYGLDAGLSRACKPVGRNVGISLGAGGLFVDALRVLGCET